MRKTADRSVSIIDLAFKELFRRRKKIQVNPESRRPVEQFEDKKKIQVDPESRRPVDSSKMITSSKMTTSSKTKKIPILKVEGRSNSSKTTTTPSKSLKTSSKATTLWRVQRGQRVSEKTSFQIRFHFREDCQLWRTFSFGKWRVNVFKHTTWLDLLYKDLYFR